MNYKCETTEKELFTGCIIDTEDKLLMHILRQRAEKLCQALGPPHSRGRHHTLVKPSQNPYLYVTLTDHK